GGTIRYWVGTFPATLRTVGKDSNTVTNSLLGGLCYETLLDRHSDTLEFTPRLASHWQISDDKRTFRYRINPKAHWSDGKPVTADDVVATWDLYMDVTILDPSMQVVFGKFQRPRAVSKYIVEVESKDLNWRNFLYFSTSLPVFAAHEIGGMSGRDFLKEFQFAMPVGSGPYLLRDRDIKKGSSVTLRRRSDYWAWKERFSTGLYNFDAIRLVATAEYNYVLAFEQAKKGQIDFFQVMKAQDWVEEIPKLESVRRGLLQTRRIYNDKPMGTQGIAINIRRPPLDDVRVRKSLCFLQDRAKLIEKLFFNEYRPLDSYYAGSQFANPDNERIRYNPGKAKTLLEEAGWKERDSNGVLVQDGKRLEFEIVYSGKTIERVLTVLQEDCMRAGVKIYLKEINPATMFQSVQGDRKFQLASMAWTGLVDPNPETSWLSSLADKKNNNNITGFKDARVDEIITAYDQMFDLEERVEAIRELDGIVFKQHPYILAWGLDNIRIIYWDKFGHPDWYLGRTARAEGALTTWWVDKEKEKRLARARKDSSVKLEAGPTVIRYWQERQRAEK
ncbi:MAG: extracellular solute-binding protein, partial [Pirellulaceae bacterium]